MSISQIYILAAIGGFILGALSTSSLYGFRLSCAVRRLNKTEARLRHPSSQSFTLPVPRQGAHDVYDMPPGWLGDDS